MIPYEGRYDALLPTAFSYSKTSNSFQVTGNLPSVEGEVRDAKWINYGNGKKVLVVARNNNELLFFENRN